jgi:hypothetical protein
VLEITHNPTVGGLGQSGKVAGEGSLKIDQSSLVSTGNKRFWSHWQQEAEKFITLLSLVSG